MTDDKFIHLEDSQATELHIEATSNGFILRECGGPDDGTFVFAKASDLLEALKVWALAQEGDT